MPCPHNAYHLSLVEVSVALVEEYEGSILALPKALRIPVVAQAQRSHAVSLVPLVFLFGTPHVALPVVEERSQLRRSLRVDVAYVGCMVEQD